ncbi:glycosyltransferase [Thioalkalivibrio paradoxus]|uniref:Glycosyl transferase n=1 Tax=Thioalkalivibrio paradoxus ARh 1 TaxID=713585 RepID=W0DNV7_9GAMM|nr:glycosyltransferase [Thioalkalivibrio paradoxus]AHE98942.1 glycosyl transferase [Thioalkalivibrio paradoxus ARh 1]
MTTPRFSVLLPVFNHARYVGQAIDSVLQQTTSDLELLIVDDASSDSSWDVVNGFQDPRIRAARHERNQGAHATLNELLRLARGQWIAILNSDDLFHPQRLEVCGERLEASGADLVGSDITLIDAHGQPVAGHWWVDAFARLKDCLTTTGDWTATLLEGNVFMSTSNFVFTRSLALDLQGFRDFSYVLDYDFLLRALLLGRRLDWVASPLLSYRLHGDNTIGGDPMRANLECARLLRELSPDLIAGDDAVRALRLEHLVSQWQRVERYIGEIAAAQRHEALVAKENELIPLIRDRDDWIAQRDQWIAEREGWIAERDVWIQDRDRWIEERDAKIVEQHLRIDALRLQRTRRIEEAEALRAEVARLNRNPVLRLARAAAAPFRWVRRHWPAVRAGQGPLIKVRGFPELRGYIAPRLTRVSCVSFDVFDTLLARCIEPPEDLHRRVATLLARQVEGVTVATVLAARAAVEHRLRQQASQDGLDHECHYDPLIEGWITDLAGHADPDLIELVQRTERELEILALAAKPGARDTLEWLRRSGVRVIAVSDMYLSHDHLVELLEHCGLGSYIDRVYVSSEFGLGKYTGRLHRKVLEVEGLAPQDIIHVGDNLISDMNVPTQLGMTGVFLDEREERLRRRRQTLSSEMACRGGIWPGRRLFEIVEFRMGQCPAYQQARHDSYFEYGAHILGPAFGTFFLGLARQIEKIRPERIYFLARDGFLFQRMYERWRELETRDTEAWPEPTYLYASRRVVATASVADGLTPEQAIVAFYNPKQQGLQSLFKTFGLPPEEFAGTAVRHGFVELDEPLEDWHDPRLLSFLEDREVQDRIRTHGIRARDRLQRYFAEHGFFDSTRVALVDIGWNGTIQKFLEDSFSSRPDFPELHGWYFAFVGQMHGDFGAGERIQGIMFDQRRNDPYERAVMEFEELFEQGARSAEGTTLGYQSDGEGRVHPVLKEDSAPDRQDEISCNPLIERFQQGVLTHLEHFHAAWRLTGYDFDQIRPYTLALVERAVIHPTREEVALISRLAHTEDFGHDALLALGPGTVRRRDLLRPRALVDKLRRMAWPQGAMASQRVPLANLALRGLQFLRIRRRIAQ